MFCFIHREELEKSAVEIQKWKQNVVEIQDRYIHNFVFHTAAIIAVFKHNCGIKKFDKIMVNKYKCIEFTM